MNTKYPEHETLKAVRAKEPTPDRITCSWCRQLIVPGSGHSCQEQDDWDDNDDARG